MALVAGAVVVNLEGDDKNLQQALKGAKNGLEGFGNGVKKSLGFVAEVSKLAVVGIVGMGIAFAGLGFKNAVQIQSGMADVQKSAGLTSEEVGSLRDQILDLSVTTATSTFDLIGIAKIGGAIGVAKDDLIAFTASIDKVSVALGDEFAGGAEEVSSTLGTLRNLFKDTSAIPYSEAMMKIGSAINSLGASGTATGPVVAEFASRMGQLGPALSPNITQTLGLGAAFQELGLSAEISSGGLSNILITAGNKAPKFAKQMGISTKAFDDLIKKSPNDMLLKLADSFKNISNDPIKLAQAMTELGLGSQESLKVMGLLATKTDFVKEKQALASEEFKKGSSIIDEYNIKNNTMQALFGKAQNMFVKFSSSLWNANLGAIGVQFQKILDGVQPLYELLVNGNFTGGLSKVFGWEEDDTTVATILNLRTEIQKFGEYLQVNLAPKIQEFRLNTWSKLAEGFNFFTTDILPKLTNFWNTILYPAFQILGIYITTLLIPALTELWNVFTTQLLPTLWNVSTALQPLAPIFLGLAGIMLGIFLFAVIQVINIFKNLLSGASQAMNGVATGVRGAIEVVTGLFTGDLNRAGEGFKKIFSGISDFVIGWAKIILTPINSVLDTVKQATNAVNSLPSNINGFKLPGRASGGEVSANQAYAVGENLDGSFNKTTELFVPKQSGKIINAEDTQAMMGNRQSNPSSQSQKPSINIVNNNTVEYRGLKAPTKTEQLEMFDNLGYGMQKSVTQLLKQHKLI